MGMSARIWGRTALGAFRRREKRVAERIAIADGTVLTLRKAAVTYGARGSDITGHGMLVEAQGRISPRDLIEVDLPEVGWTAAQVRWSGEGGRLGCKFLEPIEPAEFRRCLSNMLAA